MTVRHFFLVLGSILIFSSATLYATEAEIQEKRMRVAMRKIGHEVLMHLGDCESRVLPIQHLDKQYKISFEAEFGFDPGDLAAIIRPIMEESKAVNHYLVEVEQCATKEVVHSFEVGIWHNPQLLACSGRVQPQDCYNILVNILDHYNLVRQTPVVTQSSDDSPLSFPELNFTAFSIIPLLLLIGFTGYFLQKKHRTVSDPNLHSIGSFSFDKRTGMLSRGDQQVELSNKESELLALLYSSANGIVRREVILQRVWEDEGDYVGRTLDVFISKLRKKLEGDPSVKIVNVRGVGYKLLIDGSNS